MGPSAAAVAASFALVNWLPFDSYSIAWERRQLLYFALYYLALTLPFMAGGLGIGAALAAGGAQSHRIYAANLFVLGRLNLQGRAPLSLTISPYKGLAHAQRYPGAARTFGGWNAIARVDVLRDAGTRQLPGLSYAHPGAPSPQLGPALDAGALQPVTLVTPAEFEAAAYLPEALAYELRPGAAVLILEPGAGLGVLQALAGGAA